MDIGPIESLFPEVGSAATPSVPVPDFFLQMLTALLPTLLGKIKPEIERVDAAIEDTDSSQPEHSTENKQLETAKQEIADALDPAVLNTILQLMQPVTNPDSTQTQSQTEQQAATSAAMLTVVQPGVSAMATPDNKVKGEKKAQADEFVQQETTTSAPTVPVLKIEVEPDKQDQDKFSTELLSELSSAEESRVKIPTQLAHHQTQTIKILQDFAQVVQQQVDTQPALPITLKERIGYTPNTQPVSAVTIDLPESGVAFDNAVHANIRIYPPELGQVIAKVRIIENVANLTITAENETVKQIIQNSLPQLKEQFHQAGMNVQTVTVDVQPNFANDAQNNDSTNQQKPTLQENVIHPAAANEGKEGKAKSVDSLVDTYA